MNRVNEKSAITTMIETIIPGHIFPARDGNHCKFIIGGADSATRSL
jgi:hypothetical protein